MKSNSLILSVLLILIGFPLLAQQPCVKCDIEKVKNASDHLGNLTYQIVDDLLCTFDSICNDNVEFKEWSNEVLYKVIHNNPNLFFQVVMNTKVDNKKIIKELANPVTEPDYNQIYTKIESADAPAGLKSLYLAAVQKAAKNAEIKIKAQLNEDDDGLPPFKDSCLCTFREFGRYKISDVDYNIYLCGQGWNPNFQSCSFIWGEIISNEIPNDTSVLILKIHLLDLKEFRIPTNKTEYGSEEINQHVIAIYQRNKLNGKDSCTFDPFKTGKYPVPAGWKD